MDNNRLYVKVGRAVKVLLAGKQVMLQKDDECTDTIVQVCTDVFKDLEINFTESLIFLQLKNAELKRRMWVLAEKLGKRQEDGSIHVDADDLL